MLNKTTMVNQPYITIIIPCRNEEAYVSQCIESILDMSFPKDDYEILIADGMSEDKTREILSNYQKKYDFIKVIDNPQHIVPTAMNAAIRASKGKYIVRLDMHSVYPKNYVSTLIDFMESHGAANVGAAWETLPANDSCMARSIAISLSSTFGVGNSEYRTVSDHVEEYFETDAVPFGCYPREIFDQVGYYDEQLVRNQDDELNERIIKNGGKMYLIPSLRIKYFARENFIKVYRMMFQYGYFGPLVSVKLKTKRRLRKYIPSVFVLTLVLPTLLGLILPVFFLFSLVPFLLYLMLGIYFTVKDSAKANKVALAPLVFWSCMVSHFGYGLGYLKGIIDFSLLKKHNKGVKVKLSR